MLLRLLFRDYQLWSLLLHRELNLQKIGNPRLQFSLYLKSSSASSRISLINEIQIFEALATKLHLNKSAFDPKGNHCFCGEDEEGALNSNLL